MAKDRKSGTLVALALLFACGGMLRIGMSATQAIALVPEFSTEEDAPFVDYKEAELKTLFDAMTRREEKTQERISELDAREAALDEKAQLLETKRQDVLALLDTLEARNEELRRTMAMGETAAQDDLDQLTRVYEAMKPKEAAALFTAMAPDFAAGFLGRMKPAPVAAIMGNMSPDVAYSISAILAGRNATLPRDKPAATAVH